jgi:exonuclease VII small subunit
LFPRANGSIVRHQLEGVLTINAEGRKKLDQLLEVLNAVRDDVETLADAEREKFENMNENLQATEKGQALDEAATDLENAASTLEDVITNLETARG